MTLTEEMHCLGSVDSSKILVLFVFSAFRVTCDFREYVILYWSSPEETNLVVTFTNTSVLLMNRFYITLHADQPLFCQLKGSISTAVPSSKVSFIQNEYHFTIPCRGRFHIQIQPHNQSGYPPNFLRTFLSNASKIPECSSAMENRICKDDFGINEKIMSTINPKKPSKIIHKSMLIIWIFLVLGIFLIISATSCAFACIDGSRHHSMNDICSNV